MTSNTPRNQVLPISQANGKAPAKQAAGSPTGPPLSLRLEEWLTEQHHWRHVKVVQLLCVVFIVIYTYGGFEGSTVRQPGTGHIVDPYHPENTARGVIVTQDGIERSIVATSTFQIVCLSIARVTAFYMYPCLVLIYLSKLRATLNLIAQTPFAMFVCDDWHDLHVYCGWSIFINSILHTIFHIIRYADQGHLELLVTNRSGLSGLIVFISLFLICLPMMFTSIKNKLRYEIRKGFHYFFYIFAIAMAFHSPASAFPNGGFAPYVFGTMITWYLLDALYCSVMLTEKIDTTVFDVLPSGVQCTMAVSDRYNTGITGGYCYICLPWVDKYQWHAFSLFEHPTNPNLKQVFMMKTGDWTTAVHTALQRNTVRPVWIQGPFTSPYNRSVDYDNQIMVASGIGITPALSVIRAQKDTRRTNLIWMVREPELLEFFLERAYLDHSGWNLFFYTGKKPLVSSRIDQLTSTNVQVIQGRPNLPMVIRNIIYGIESGKGCPTHYVQDQKVEVARALLNTLEELEPRESLTTHEKFGILADTAMEYGFQLTNTLYCLDGLFESTTTNEEGSEKFNTEQQSEFSWTDVEKQLLKEQDELGGEFAMEAREAKVIEKLVEMAGPSAHSSRFLQQLGGGQSSRAFGTKALPSARRLRRGTGMGMSLGTRTSRNLKDARPSRKMNVGHSPSHPSGRHIAAMPSAHTLFGESYHQRQAQRDILVGEAMEIGFKPWEEDAEADEFVKLLDESHLATWGLLYCGGSKLVEDKLKQASSEYNIELHSENFSW